MSITITNLYKRYNDNVIFNNISFEFKDKGKYIILGENGVGKTTLIKCILKQIKFYGFINVDGIISFAPSSPVLPESVTLYKFIKTFSNLTTKYDDFDKELDDLLKIFKLTKKKYTYLSKLSTGEKMKVNLILALIKSYDILILDEPLNGLDKESKEALNKVLSELDKLIIIITHDINDFSRFMYTMLEVKNDSINILNKIN